jgi:hypothetical protein
VKTFEINNPAAAPPQGEVTAPQEPNAALKQRLWELLLPLPEAADAAPIPALAQTAARASTADGQHARGTQRASQVGSELITAAYVLAGHIQQLSLWGAASAALKPLDQPNGAPAPAYTVQLESEADGGGRASVELSHPELGSVSLSVELSSGAVRVTATAENERSAQVIAEGQAILTERLARQGVALEALDVVIVPNRKTRTRARARARARREET